MNHAKRQIEVQVAAHFDSYLSETGDLFERAGFRSD
jgi:hypothetical protein